MSTILDKLTALEAAGVVEDDALQFVLEALPALLRLAREAVNVELDYIRTPNRRSFWEAREALLVEVTS